MIVHVIKGYNFPSIKCKTSPERFGPALLVPMVIFEVEKQAFGTAMPNLSRRQHVSLLVFTIETEESILYVLKNNLSGSYKRITTTDNCRYYDYLYSSVSPKFKISVDGLLLCPGITVWTLYHS